MAHAMADVMNDATLFPDSSRSPDDDALSSGEIFMIMQTVRSSRDGTAETMRLLERRGQRGKPLHALAVAAVNACEIFRHRLACEYEVRVRLEPKRRKR